MGDLLSLAATIRSSESIVLSTHRESDGDGIGAQVALFHALKKAGKQVRLLNVDGLPKRYLYLDTDKDIQFFESAHLPLGKTDLALIFDTNDQRMLEPLYSLFQQKCSEIIFVDHHPILSRGPKPPPGSLIDISAASTGEIAYNLILELGIPIDRKIARALYTSIAFDTQIFRFIRKSGRSHEIAAELLKYDVDPEDIHRKLFGSQTIPKLSFLSKALGNIEYYGEGRLALLRIRDHDLIHFGLEAEASRDVIDMVMNIESLEIAVLFREDGPNSFKVSLRSKGRIEILSVAETLGGGGHLFSAGAYWHGPYDDIKEKTIAALLGNLRELPVTDKDQVD